MVTQEAGVLSSSRIFFHEATEFAKSALYYVSYAGDYKCTEKYRIDRNYLDTFLMMHVDSGVMRISYQGKSYLAPAGTIVLLDCKYPHVYGASGNLEFRWFHFSGNSSQQYCDMLLKQFGCIFNMASSSEAGPQWTVLFEMFQNGNVQEHLVSIAVHTILANLSSNYQISKSNFESAMQNAVVFIETHFSENIAIADIASSVSMSPYHFLRLFKKYKNITPHGYLTNVRIRKAKQLLLATDESLETIAEKCGFNSVCNFIRVFRLNVQFTPNSFRKMKF